MDKLPAGQFRAEKLPKTLKMSGEVYVRTENPLGLMGYYVVGDGKIEPYRLKMRTAVVLERQRDPRACFPARSSPT